MPKRLSDRYPSVSRPVAGPLSETVPLDEAKERLDVGLKALRRMLQENKIPGGIHSGSVYRIVRGPFERWMAGDVEETAPIQPPIPLIARRPPARSA